MKHIEGTSPGVGMIAVKVGDRHQIMDSFFPYQQKGLACTISKQEGKDGTLRGETL